MNPTLRARPDGRYTVRCVACGATTDTDDTSPVYAFYTATLARGWVPSTSAEALRVVGPGLYCPACSASITGAPLPDACHSCGHRHLHRLVHCQVCGEAGRRLEGGSCRRCRRRPSVRS